MCVGLEGRKSIMSFLSKLTVNKWISITFYCNLIERNRFRNNYKKVASSALFLYTSVVQLYSSIENNS